MTDLDWIKLYADPDNCNIKANGTTDLPEWYQFQELCRVVLLHREEISRLDYAIQDLRGELRDAKREIDRLQGRSEPYG